MSHRLVGAGLNWRVAAVDLWSASVAVLVNQHPVTLGPCISLVLGLSGLRLWCSSFVSHLRIKERSFPIRLHPQLTLQWGL